MLQKTSRSYLTGVRECSTIIQVLYLLFIRFKILTGNNSLVSLPSWIDLKFTIQRIGRNTSAHKTAYNIYHKISCAPHRIGVNLPSTNTKRTRPSILEKPNSMTATNTFIIKREITYIIYLWSGKFVNGPSIGMVPQRSLLETSLQDKQP